MISTQSTTFADLPKCQACGYSIARLNGLIDCYESSKGKTVCRRCYDNEQVMVDVESPAS
jgi:hypothetical protein